MPRSATEDALDQLDRCHRRHDQELAALIEAVENLASAHAGPGDLDAIAEAIAYFERATPRHFADEEESLFPRLAAAVPELRGEIDRIVAEHTEHLVLHARLRELYDGWNNDVPSADDAAALAAVADELDRAQRKHVDAEDALFARARAALDAAAIAAVGDDMDARREASRSRDRR